MADYLTLLRRDINKFSKGNWVVDNDRLLYYLEEMNSATGTGGGGSAIAVLDEGTQITAGATSLNFTGNSIQASAAGTAVTVSVDSHIAIQVKNNTGSTLTKGTVCYILPNGSSSTHPDVVKADATTEATSSKTIGVIHTTISNGNIGLLITNGEIEGTGSEPLDTSMYTSGTKLWLSTTPGQYTSTAPAFPNHTVFIGHVTRSQNTNGRILVSIQNGYELNELHDTKFTGLNQGDVLMYDDETGPRPFWYNQPMTMSHTTTELLSKQSTGVLITNGWYYVLNKPTDWTVYVQASGPSVFNPKGVAFYTGAGAPSEMDCWYDLVNNSIYKIYDPRYNNTVEGLTNIYNFKWNNSNWSDNYISEGSSIIIDVSTSVTVFNSNTIIDGSVLDISAASVGEISFNTITSGASLNLNLSFASSVKYNLLSNCNVNASSATFSTLSTNNISSNSSVSISGSYITTFDGNTISGSSSLDIGTLTSYINSFSYNKISISNIYFQSIIVNDVTLNEISSSTIYGSDCGSAKNISSNIIFGSDIQLENATNIVNCNISCMGKNSQAIIDTGYQYDGAYYVYKGDSTFYCTYDIDDPTYYDAANSEFILPTGHTNWIGRAILLGATGPYLITDIANHPEYQTINILSTGQLIELRDTTGFLKISLGAAPVDLATKYDYAKFNGIREPIGLTSGGSMYLVDYKQY